MCLWIYGLFLDLISFCANALLGVMSTDLTFWETSVPVVGTLYKVFVAVGWGLLIGNLAFQSMKAMFAGFGFETESPAILLFRTALFGTLLVFSKDVCEIGLSIGKNIIDLLGIPTSVTITFPDETFFASIGASWLLVIIIGFILGFQLIKLFFEIAERYVIVAILTLLCPVGLAMGGSKSTKDICTGFIRTFASMIVMMVLNVLFLKLILSALSTMPSGMLVLPWCLLVVGIAKTARKADNLVAKIGLNPAITGDPLGHGRGAMIAMMAARTIMHSATKSGKGKSDGAKTSETSNKASSNVSNNTRNAVGGTNVGGNNMHTAANADSAEHTSTNATNNQNAQNTQGTHFGAANSTANTQSANSTRFGSASYGSTKNTGVSSGQVFGSTGKTSVNTNRFGAQTGSTSTGHGPKKPSPTVSQGTKISKSGLRTTPKAPPKSAPKASSSVPTKKGKFGAVPSGTPAKNAQSGMIHQNENPFKKSASVPDLTGPVRTTPQKQVVPNQVSDSGQVWEPVEFPQADKDGGADEQ